MPYTRNTRIKQIKWKHKQTSEAQVEYRFPFTKITKWVNFEDSHPNFVAFLLGQLSSTPWDSYIEALSKDENDEKTGEEWAKAIIDQYHKLLDDVEAVPEVTYKKYPD